MTTQTAAEINAKTDASLASRNAQSANPPKPASKAAAKPAAAKPAPAKVAPKATPAPRKALTPRERAAKPVTQTIQDYVAWLERELGQKFTEKDRKLAGVAITLYGAYQTSPERRAARAAK